MKTVYDVRLENIRRLVDAYDGTVKFAEIIDRAPSLVSRYAGKNPKRTIGNDMARHIESKCNLEPGSLDFGQDDGGVELATGVTTRLPVIESASDLCAMNSNAFTGEWVETPGVFDMQAFAIKMSGDSMISPSGKGIPDGAIVIATPPHHMCINGRIIVAKMVSSNTLTIKKLENDAGAFLVPINPRYPVLSANDHEWEVMGVAIRVQYNI